MWQTLSFVSWLILYLLCVTKLWRDPNQVGSVGFHLVLVTSPTKLGLWTIRHRHVCVTRNYVLTGMDISIRFP
jgi:hypothetical protein